MAPATTTQETTMNTTTNKAMGICADIFLGLRAWEKQAEGHCDVNEIGSPINYGSIASIIVTDADGRSYEVIVKPV
jgi:hypothetical protein